MPMSAPSTPPASPADRSSRPRRPAGRTVQHLDVDHDARAAARRRRDLEGLQRPAGLALFSPLPYFKAYTETARPPAAARRWRRTTRRTSRPTWRPGTLPQVQLDPRPLTQCEHPAPRRSGARTWSSRSWTRSPPTPRCGPTRCSSSYDENGGFFDHVPPPVPPAGTAGEYLTAVPLPADASGYSGRSASVSGCRVSLMSPFTTGGYSAAEVFDHTSTLLLIEKLFGVPVPNVSAWRRSTVGDLTRRLRSANRRNRSPRRCPSRRWRCPSSTRRSSSTP